MIDLGQARTVQDTRDSVVAHTWPDAGERALRSRAIETGHESDWQAWRTVRDARIWAGIITGK